MFVLPPPLENRTSAASEAEPGKAGIQSWFDTWEGGIGYERVEVEIHVDGDLASATDLVRMVGKRTDGTETDLWFRETLGFTRQRGEWKIFMNSRRPGPSAKLISRLASYLASEGIFSRKNST